MSIKKKPAVTVTDSSGAVVPPTTTSGVVTATVLDDPKQPVVATPGKNIIAEFLKDLVSLRLPVTAASVVGVVVSLADPFGLDLGTAGAIMSAAFVAIGTVAYYVQSLIARSKANG